MKTIKIFLASSGELKDERKEISLFFAQENKKLMKQNIFFELVIWEELLHSFTGERIQDYFNNEMLFCDIVIVLFHTKVGLFTIEEFNLAYQNLKNGNKPEYLFVFFKETKIPISEINEEILEINKLKKEIEKLNQLYDSYTSIQDLILKIKNQVDYILQNVLVVEKEIKNFTKKNKKNYHIEGFELAPDVSFFYGRINEFTKLEEWILQENCRLITILGIAGIGKTYLSAKIVQMVKNEFEYVIWHRLLNAPPVTEILFETIKLLSNQQEINIPKDLDKQISCLIQYCINKRCLIVLDNVESVLLSGEFSGKFRKGYESYGTLFRELGVNFHKSCFLLTSREKTNEINLLEGRSSPVRSIILKGIDIIAGKKVFEDVGSFVATDEEWKKVINLYDGNPLAIKLTAKHIDEVFFGNISSFLSEDKTIFSDLIELLSWHFNRLSNFEKEVMYWLAIEREPVTFSELKRDILSLISKNKLSSTLQSLQRKIPLEKSESRFTLQPVLLEYMTDSLIEKIGDEITINKNEIYKFVTNHFVKQVNEEIKNKKLVVFNQHSIMKALAKDYIRESQIRFIVKPIIEELFSIFQTKQNIVRELIYILSELRQKSIGYSGYASGNIVNLLVQLHHDLKGIDLSNLSIREPYLQGVNLHDVNFYSSDFINSVFTETFGAILTVSYSPNGNLLATANNSGEIHIWQSPNFKKIFVCTGHNDWIRFVDFSPDSKYLASCSNDQTVRLWNVETGQCLRILEGHTNWIRSVRFSPCGLILASCGDDNKIILWDINTGKHITSLLGHEGPVWSIDFSSCGQTLASAGHDRTIRLWCTKTMNCIRVLKGNTHWIRKIKFSPDNNFLVSAGDDSYIWLWDLKDENKCIRKLKGHTDRIWSIDYSPDGKIIASGSFDTTIRLWKAKTGKCHKVLQGHSNWIRSISISPDSKSIVSGGDDQTIKFWDIDIGLHSSRTILAVVATKHYVYGILTMVNVLRF